MRRPERAIFPTDDLSPAASEQGALDPGAHHPAGVLAPVKERLEAPSQVVPTACRPSLTAAPRGGQSKVQAGTER